MKNPVILPRSGRLTELVIHPAHLTTLHGGARLTLAYIRQRYWIIGGNRAVKTQLRLCVRCHRYKPSEASQLMGELPSQRVTPSRPFTHTGVDFTGHVDIKLNKGRGVRTTKGYICIFVCMATKAVHIELVSDLSTDTFIAAFQRMCSRRGTPSHVYSDCGTNFVGAAKLLRKEFDDFKNLLSEDFFTNVAAMGVQWHFNAPAWPSAGGLWESAVKSMKYHLRRVLGEQKLTYEEFTTLLTKIEACMNSRPLCALTEDPEEFYHYLTPGHFLTGGPVLALPRADFSEERKIDMRSRWQLTERMLQQFWKSWSSDYLSQLQVRGKWNESTKNLAEGDIVLVRDNNIPPGKWALGRVLELHPGADGYVRVTALKTQSGVIKRPLVKLSRLPIQPTCSEGETTSSTPATDKPLVRRKNSKTKRVNYNCLTTMLLFLATVLTGMNGSYGARVSYSAQITNIEPERHIYYDTIGKIQLIHDEWTLLTYYNITNYWNGVEHIEKYIGGITKLCEQIHRSYCQATIDQLSHEMEVFQMYNAMLLTPHKHLSDRKKRGLIDGVGTIANSLFGILDQRFADKYHQDIDAIQHNENYLLELTRNQTSILQLQNDVLRKNDENIQQQCKMINHFIKESNDSLGKISTELQIMMATNYVNTASLTASLLLHSLKEIQTMLLNTLTNVYSGHMDIHLLSPVTLVKQLQEIAGKLPKTLSLPIDNIRDDMRDLYKLLYVKARITKNYFMFEVHIPLIADEDFIYYRAIAIPFQTESRYHMLKLSSSYIAVNFRKNTYISLSAEDLKQCIKRQTDIFICNANIPVSNLHSDSAPCEAKLLSHRTSSPPCNVASVSCEEAWIKLREPNSWLTVCCGRCDLRTICENDVTSYAITTPPIVTLTQGCVLQSKDLTISAHNKYNSKLNVDYGLRVPELNSSANSIINVSLHKVPQYNSGIKDIDEVDKRLKSQQDREQGLPSTVTFHDIHQYTICYLILAIAIIVFLLTIRRRYLKRHRKTDKLRMNEQQTPEEIELQPIRTRQRTRTETHHHGRADDRDVHTQETAAVENISFSFD